MWDIAFFTTLAILSGAFGFFYATRKHPRATMERQLLKDRDEIIASLRKEVKRATATANWYKQGAIPAGVKNVAEASADDPAAIIDAFLNAIPPNYKLMVQPFREKIIEEARNNPEAFNTIVNVIKEKAMSRAKEENAVQNDAL